jgi:membrane-associated phospholipid phosphatase
MPEWGFTDSISQFLGVPHIDDGPGKAFLNFYAAVPSMHVCFAIIIGWSMALLVKTRPAKLAWALYPFFITFLVVATGNHYLTDAVLGGLTAGAAAVLAKRLLARARPDKWAFGHATA